MPEIQQTLPVTSYSPFALPTPVGGGRCEYRYLTTNLITGQLQADWLPLEVESFSAGINGGGTFTGSLVLETSVRPGDQVVQDNLVYLAGIEPRKSVLWCLQDGIPIWNGIIWNWTPESILGGLLEFSASTMDSLFAKRIITEDLNFLNADVFDIFRALLLYAVGKTPNGQVAGLVTESNESGITETISYTGTDYQTVADAWQALIALTNIEYAFVPGTDANGNLITTCKLGYPILGNTPDVTGLVFQFPGNLYDYEYTRTGDTSSNTVYATASASQATQALNENGDFVTGIPPWTAINGASTPVLSAVWTESGSYSALQTSNGSTANPGMQSEKTIQIIPETEYSVTADSYSPQGWAAGTLVGIKWFAANGGQNGPTILGAAQPLVATTTSFLSVAAVAPAGTAFAQIFVYAVGVPANTIQFFWDDIYMELANPPSDGWQSEPPAGQDTVDLGNGYPLLETVVSYPGSVAILSQEQINNYANGILPSLTGSQDTPVVILGADQYPKVNQMNLGDGCYFVATSSMHPSASGTTAMPGPPGLQYSGRIVGWTLQPQSQGQQVDQTSVQLGSLAQISAVVAAGETLPS
jgi:hypothetical protein